MLFHAEVKVLSGMFGAPGLGCGGEEGSDERGAGCLRSNTMFVTTFMSHTSQAMRIWPGLLPRTHTLAFLKTLSCLKKMFFSAFARFWS